MLSALFIHSFRCLPPYFSSRICLVISSWILSVELPRVPVLSSWLHWVVSLCCLSAHWASLKQLFWILFQAVHWSLFILGQLVGNYCVPRVASSFLDFSVKSVLLSLHIKEAITSSRLSRLALGNACSSQPDHGFQSFLGLWDMPAPHCLFPFGNKIVGLLSLLQSQV